MSIFNFIFLSDREKKIINTLKKTKSESMRVVGRGTLIKDPLDVKKPDFLRSKKEK